MLVALAALAGGCATQGLHSRKVAVRPSADELAAEERMLQQPFALAVPEDAIVRIVGPVMTCTGAVISGSTSTSSPDLILTAHHCLVERGPHGEFTKTNLAPSQIK